MSSKDNVLTNLNVDISLNDSEDIMREKLLIANYVFSYVIRQSFEQNKVTGYTIQYNISQTDAYNTISIEERVNKILFILNSKHDNRKIIAYEQPTLTLLYELYTPLLKKLAYQQCQNWNNLEYDDAYQMACYSLTKLYKKGYYVHKSILEQTYRNDILMYLRPAKDTPQVVSLENLVAATDETMDVYDVLKDTKFDEDEETKEQEELIKNIFNCVKDLIIDMIGQRQFDQLFRDYTNKHTTNWSRKTMFKIKNHLRKLGLNWQHFTNKFIGE